MSEQPDLFGPVPARPFDAREAFGGSTFDPEQDGARLSRQLDQVRAHMLQAGWQSLAEIHAATGFPEASISARLRNLREAQHGGYQVIRRRRTVGTHEYRVCTEEER